MKQELHFHKGDLTGEISLTLKEGRTLHELFAQYVFDYTPERFEPCAFRLLLGKENVLTLYAVDGLKITGNKKINSDKIPVKKFKISGVPFNEVVEYFGELNFTVTANNFPIETMEVTNK
ncbi:hypothetical protein [Flavihumibacter fluvii]|uniref:hypothetical protein n=1 Tax=Flavihumibacter fluvii TaxID=2838157 RepID=UPI001BDDE125|nr:hypothetical protein [Flavihumibacter fluvii]ULQ50963.1 hypothetical protein KJS93_12795 [Flavihumibacter fluvii]